MVKPEFLDGGCLCGAIRIRCLQPPNLVEYCHCNSCQKASGAPAMAWMGIPSAGFTVQKGDLAIFKPSAAVERGFCRECGTTLSISSTDYDEEVYVSVACMDEAGSIEPEVHVWRSDRLPWFETDDELPRYVRFKYEGIVE